MKWKFLNSNTHTRVHLILLAVKPSNFRAQHIIYPSNLLIPPSLFSLPRFMENKPLHYYIMSFFKLALLFDMKGFTSLITVGVITKHINPHFWHELDEEQNGT
jgi:hypothetical protein